MEHINPPLDPDMSRAFRIMSYDDLVRHLRDMFGIEPLDTYKERHRKTIVFVGRGLKPMICN